MRGRLIIAALLLEIAFFAACWRAALVAQAVAQTVPPFDPGSAPTQGTWDTYFGSKQDLIKGLSAVPIPGPYSAAGTPIPTCNADNAGQNVWSNDITTMTYNATYVSGGALIGPLFCNGTNWTAH
jgi:hypothetical protein